MTTAPPAPPLNSSPSNLGIAILSFQDLDDINLELIAALR